MNKDGRLTAPGKDYKEVQAEQEQTGQEQGKPETGIQSEDVEDNTKQQRKIKPKDEAGLWPPVGQKGTPHVGQRLRVPTLTMEACIHDIKKMLQC